MTKLEIIKMVAGHYNLGNRAIGREGKCQYITHDGRMCAVGMCIEEDRIEDLQGELMDVLELDAEWGLQELLKEEYKGHSLGFWSDIQRLHDDVENWDESGISEIGKERVRKIKKEYENYENYDN